MSDVEHDCFADESSQRVLAQLIGLDDIFTEVLGFRIGPLKHPGRVLQYLSDDIVIGGKCFHELLPFDLLLQILSFHLLCSIV